jgi:hypothetical protein
MELGEQESPGELLWALLLCSGVGVLSQRGPAVVMRVGQDSEGVEGAGGLPVSQRQHPPTRHIRRLTCLPRD